MLSTPMTPKPLKLRRLCYLLEMAVTCWKCQSTCSKWQSYLFQMAVPLFQMAVPLLEMADLLYKHLLEQAYGSRL